jgi:hypothetical protein
VQDEPGPPCEMVGARALPLAAIFERLTLGGRWRTGRKCALGGARSEGPETPNLLIRRLCRACPLPAYFTADLPRCYSLVRSRRQH